MSGGVELNGLQNREKDDGGVTRMSAILRGVRDLYQRGIQVIYLDKQILVINKSSGVITQATHSKDPVKQVRPYVFRHNM